jgi:hypothetical protein
MNYEKNKRTGNEDSYFNSGFERGKEGASHGGPFWGDFIPPSESEEAARQRGYEAGKIQYEAEKSKKKN